MLLTAAAVLLLIPVAAAFGTATHTRLERQAQTLAAGVHYVPAVLLEDTYLAADTPRLCDSTRRHREHRPRPLDHTPRGSRRRRAHRHAREGGSDHHHQRRRRRQPHLPHPERPGKHRGRGDRRLRGLGTHRRRRPAVCPGEVRPEPTTLRPGRFGSPGRPPQFWRPSACMPLETLWFQIPGILPRRARCRWFSPTRRQVQPPNCALSAHAVTVTRHRSVHPRPLLRPARRRRRSATLGLPTAATDHTAHLHPQQRPRPPDSDTMPGTPQGGGPSRPLVPPHQTRRAPPEAPPPADQP